MRTTTRKAAVSGAFAALLALFVGYTGALSEVPTSETAAAARSSLFGSYLAGRTATSQRDNRIASLYYNRALKIDPSNEVILHKAFVLDVFMGDFEEAVKLAKRVLKMDKSQHLAQLVLGVHAAKRGAGMKATAPQAAGMKATASQKEKGSMRTTTRKAAVSGAFAALLALFVGYTGALSEVPTSETAAAARSSLFGSYLAGRTATSQRDNRIASLYYNRALKIDPSNEVILHKAFVLDVFMGDFEEAVKLAKRVLKMDKSQHLAQLVLGVHAAKRGDYAEAEKYFDTAKNNRITGLIALLSRAWAYQGQGKSRKALKLLRSKNRAAWAKSYQQYHAALIADLKGDYNYAGNIFDAMFKKEPGVLRVSLAYAQHAWNGGKTDLAKRILTKHVKRVPAHPLVKELQARIEKGDKPELLIKSVNQGLAEVYYGIGDALAGEGGVDIGTIYLQFALYLDPDFTLAKTTLAEVFEATKKYDLANEIYREIGKGNSVWESTLIRQAFNLNALDKVDDAVALLDNVLARNPRDVRALEAAGNILRSHKRYEEAKAYYSRAIDTLKKPKKEHWKYYYSRGVCFERMKDWPSAEKDLLKALKLNPDQPLVLNYLGYSWVDQKKNIKRAMKLIRKAVKLKPDDGYFVDSLGWAYYRLGKFKAGVRELERAVELKPDDPVINDHLGDAYWKVGRRLEARYQWSQSLTLKPEPEEVEKIKAKLERGLAPAKAKVVSRKIKKKVTPRKITRKKKDDKPFNPFGDVYPN